MGFLDVFGTGGGGLRGGFGPEPDTELRALLIGENPRKNWGSYLRENTRRRKAKLPLGNLSHLVADDESQWLLDMASLGTETIEQGHMEMPMPRSQFEDLQAIATQWGAGELVPHLWRGDWFCTAAFSEVPRFRFTLGDKILYPARNDSWVDDYQRALASIGVDPGELIRPDVTMKARLEKGRAARAMGIYVANGHVNNAVLRKGQVGYPVVLAELDLAANPQPPEEDN